MHIAKTLCFVCICTLVTGDCPFDGDFKCNDTGLCLRSHNVCDGFSTCRHGGDEENCGKNIIHIFYIFQDV